MSEHDVDRITNEVVADIVSRFAEMTDIEFAAAVRKEELQTPEITVSRLWQVSVDRELKLRELLKHAI